MVSPQPTQTEQVIRPLRELKRNWDGEDSPKISAKVLRRAEALLRDFESCRLPFPSVRPKSGGSLSMLWSSQKRDLAIDMFPDMNGFLRVTRMFDDYGEPSGSRTEQGFCDIHPRSVERLVAWFLLGNAHEA